MANPQYIRIWKHQVVYLKYTTLFICQLYFNEAGVKKNVVGETQNMLVTFPENCECTTSGHLLKVTEV